MGEVSAQRLAMTIEAITERIESGEWDPLPRLVDMKEELGIGFRAIILALRTLQDENVVVKNDATQHSSRWMLVHPKNPNGESYVKTLEDWIERDILANKYDKELPGTRKLSTIYTRDKENTSTLYLGLALARLRAKGLIYQDAGVHHGQWRITGEDGSTPTKIDRLTNELRTLIVNREWPEFPNVTELYKHLSESPKPMTAQILAQLAKEELLFRRGSKWVYPEHAVSKRDTSCMVERCDLLQHGYGLCINHLEKQYGTLRPSPAAIRCIAKDCAGKYKANGLCAKHQAQWLRYGKFVEFQKYPVTLDTDGNRICNFDGCGRRYSWLGLCTSHTSQRKQGKPLAPIQKLGSWMRKDK